MSTNHPHLRLLDPSERPVNPRLADLIPRYHDALVALAHSKDSIKHYVRAFRAFARTLGDDPTLADITTDAVVAYRDAFGERGAAASTVLNALAVIRSFCTWAKEAGLMEGDPTGGVRRPRKREPNPQPLTAFQVETLLGSIVIPDGLSRAEGWRWRRNRRIVYLMLFAGLRMNEARCLLWRDVRFDERIMHVRPETAKGNKPRRVAIHPDLAAELQRGPAYERPDDFAVCGLPTGDPLSRGGIEHVFDRWLHTELTIDELLGTHLHAHRLRATFATWFAWSGGNILTLQQLLGHADVNTTRYYVLTDDDQKRMEMQKLRFTRNEEE